jgi:hypothetical protein
VAEALAAFLIRALRPTATTTDECSCVGLLVNRFNYPWSRLPFSVYSPILCSRAIHQLQLPRPQAQALLRLSLTDRIWYNLSRACRSKHLSTLFQLLWPTATRSESKVNRSECSLLVSTQKSCSNVTLDWTTPTTLSGRIRHCCCKSRSMRKSSPHLQDTEITSRLDRCKTQILLPNTNTSNDASRYRTKAGASRRIATWWQWRSELQPVRSTTVSRH